MASISDLDPSLRQWLEGQIQEQIVRLNEAARKQPPEWVCQDYVLANRRIRKYLHQVDLDDPNPFPGLDAWHLKWSSGDVPSRANVSAYIDTIYLRLLHILRGEEPVPEDLEALLGGWARIDRAMRKAFDALEFGQHEEDFQSVGLYCREAIISLGREVFDPAKHPTLDGVVASPTDAKRMLEAYLAVTLQGASNDATRRHARACVDLANDVQHKRTATYRAAALCAEATRSVVTLISILEGRRDPLPLSERAT